MAISHLSGTFISKLNEIPFTLTQQLKYFGLKTCQSMKYDLIDLITDVKYQHLSTSEFKCS